MNIHKSQLFWGSPGVQGFDPSPYLYYAMQYVCISYLHKYTWHDTEQNIDGAKVQHIPFETIYTKFPI